MSTTVWTQTDLLRELDQVVEGELNRHMKVAKEWFPHDYIPWSDGRNFDGLMGASRGAQTTHRSAMSPGPR